MLEYTPAGGGASLEMLVLHDDAQREYAYGPAQGLPDTRVGKFTQASYDEAKAKGWTVISMKSLGEKIVLLKEGAPLVIEQDAVGLERMLHDLAGAAVRLDQLDGAPEEV